ncbi:MAG TPA: DUF2182 domain-containing protein [Terracidiphilus sp.]|nr:DUF2182 domain-containing protein [Gemmataceae bacterium]HUA97809.1 DUF2182 domain-containing protein [Terracidiphilus sp.]
MTPAARERWQVRLPVLAICAAAWILLVVDPGGAALHSHCAVTMSETAPLSLNALLALNPPALLVAGWILMLAAMMAPLVIAPVRFLHDRSLARRRTRAIALFAAGYGLVWIAAGVVLLPMALAIRLAAPAFAAVVLGFVVAILWQFSPVKQCCLNRCHAHPALAAFGPAADAGAFRFGLTHGFWCAGACWALMLLPMLIARGHLAVMAAVTLWLFTERLDRPSPPRWNWRGPGKAMRIAYAQARMAFQRG